jgi:hypothetical protein
VQRFLLSWSCSCCLKPLLLVQHKRMSENNFNLKRYQHLMRTRERYQRYLAASAGAPRVGDEQQQQQQQEEEPAKLKVA